MNITPLGSTCRTKIKGLSSLRPWKHKNMILAYVAVIQSEMSSVCYTSLWKKPEKMRSIWYKQPGGGKVFESSLLPRCKPNLLPLSLSWPQHHHTSCTHTAAQLKGEERWRPRSHPHGWRHGGIGLWGMEKGCKAAAFMLSRPVTLMSQHTGVRMMHGCCRDTA